MTAAFFRVSLENIDLRLCRIQGLKSREVACLPHCGFQLHIHHRNKFLCVIQRKGLVDFASRDSLFVT